jgi:surface antigen
VQIGFLRNISGLFLRNLALKTKAGTKSVAIAAALAASLGGGFAAPALAGVLQCVPYARQVSNVDIRGNAKTWWGQAEGVYRRGNKPEVGAVLAFQGTRAMPYGHVATVAQIIDDRTIILNHANWSRPGMIERNARAIDVSEAGDWSSVRVWFAPSKGLGIRVNPTFGFIYGDSAPPTINLANIQVAALQR